MDQNALVGSSIDNGTTLLQCDLRQLALQQELGTTSPICWRKAPSHVDMHALSTFHTPIKYRCLIAQGSYLNDQKQRLSLPPDSKGGATSHQRPTISLRLP